MEKNMMGRVEKKRSRNRSKRSMKETGKNRYTNRTQQLQRSPVGSQCVGGCPLWALSHGKGEFLAGAARCVKGKVVGLCHIGCERGKCWLISVWKGQVLINKCGAWDMMNSTQHLYEVGSRRWNWQWEGIVVMLLVRISLLTGRLAMFSMSILKTHIYLAWSNQIWFIQMSGFNNSLNRRRVPPRFNNSLNRHLVRPWGRHTI